MIIHLPIEDILDLHTFRPQEIPSLLNDYFNECIKQNIFEVRIIHGKGKGILRNKVLEIIENHPKVLSFKSAPAEAGGWGATSVQLKNNKQQ